MKLRVGVVTLYSDCNYGNKLQTYAVQQYLGKLNLNVEVVKFYSSVIKKIIKIILKKETIKLKENRKRLKKFKDFNNYINYKWKNNNSKYDIYIYGSDQIWNYGPRGINSIYLGKNCEKKLNISFAASFGVYELPEKYKEQYRKGLEKFKAISVREDAGKIIAEELTKRNDVEVIIDPTMLLTSKDWDKVSKIPEQLDKLKSKKYILNYFLGVLPENWRNEINRIAKENDCEVINILDKNNPFYQTGPSEFLYLEKNAFLICTDSFHSCVFSIIYDTPFIVFDRQGGKVSMNSRIDTLLSKFKLESRRFNGEINDELIICDYTEVKKILEKEKFKSKEFLRKALNLEEKQIESQSN
jgi:hypothetical protein